MEEETKNEYDYALHSKIDYVKIDVKLDPRKDEIKSAKERLLCLSKELQDPTGSNCFTVFNVSYLDSLAYHIEATTSLFDLE